MARERLLSGLDDDGAADGDSGAAAETPLSGRLPVTPSRLLLPTCGLDVGEELILPPTSCMCCSHFAALLGKGAASSLDDSTGFISVFHTLVGRRWRRLHRARCTIFHRIISLFFGRDSELWLLVDEWTDPVGLPGSTANECLFEVNALPLRMSLTLLVSSDALPSFSLMSLPAAPSLFSFTEGIESTVVIHGCFRASLASNRFSGSNCRAVLTKAIASEDTCSHAFPPKSSCLDPSCTMSGMCTQNGNCEEEGGVLLETVKGGTPAIRVYARTPTLHMSAFSEP
mmetsp:Transcript_34219/g.55014  ORF Transcript_34219/g.55014 Transcript_34219/m.55014 type:complete len:285 (+) Transcript_34219:657-1511(+)